MHLIYVKDDEWLIFRFRNGFFIFFVLYKSSSIFTLGYRFSLFGSSIFFHRFDFYFTEVFTSFLQRLFAFIFVLQINCYFSVLLLVSSVIRLEYQARQASCVKGKIINLETIFPALQNWNVLHWIFKGRGLKPRNNLRFWQRFIFYKQLT